VLIVTAADHRFARTLYQMLASAWRNRLANAHSFVAFDLGMTPGDRRRLSRKFPWCAIEAFDFDDCPPHVRRLENFAWKPFLIWRVIERSEDPVLWFDSATLFHGAPTTMIDDVRRDGVFSLAGQSTLADCCDPRTLARLAPASKDLDEPYRAGGVLGFDPRRPWVRTLIRQWRDFAADPECIAPSGLDPRLHKFDQAILTAVLCRASREQGLRLGSEQIDISSTDPVAWVSTRNKVASWIPSFFDPIVRAYYGGWKRADRIALRLRRRSATG